MNKTLRISFALKNTYRVNSILFSLKQIPLLKKLIPNTFYGIRGLKIFADVLSVIWEIVSFFLGKILYLFTMVCGAGFLYDKLPKNAVFLHILFFLSVIGGFVNTHLFNPSRDKYYATVLMRMDAREYTLINYSYALIKSVIGFLPVILIFGIISGVSWWICLLIPFSIAGIKLTVAAISLLDYEKRGFAYNENRLSKYLWACIALLLAAAYGPPALGTVLPEAASTLLFIAAIPLGIVSLRKIFAFKEYAAINRELLSGLTNQMDTSAAQLIKTANEKKIEADASITSRRNGFEYLNELFVKRHKKILWTSVKKISLIILAIFLGVLIFIYLKPEIKPEINSMVMNCLPYFVFIMYAINRGTLFTQALFMNCDHSLLTYSFYRNPRFILKLFQIRLRVIIKINALPALIIGTGLSVLLFVSGGTDNPVNYFVLPVALFCLSLFFSVHYLTIYYLLQPYNAGTELKSGTYRIVLSITYFVCFIMMKLRIPTLIFGITAIAFCLIYSFLSCILIYKLSPKTFKLRI